MIALCSEAPIFRRSYVQKVLCSKIFVQKVLYSEGPSLYVQKIKRFYIKKVLCSEEPIFRRSFVQKVSCWNTFPSFSFSYKNISRFFFIPFILYYSLLLEIHASSKVTTFSELQIPKSPKFPELGNPEPKFRSSVVMHGVLCCVFFVID